MKFVQIGSHIINLAQITRINIESPKQVHIFFTGAVSGFMLEGAEAKAFLEAVPTPHPITTYKGSKSAE
jgi:hypothetical protein